MKLRGAVSVMDGASFFYELRARLAFSRPEPAKKEMGKPKLPQVEN
jgi:hypothetical protein